MANIKQTKDGLIEKSTGRKIESPLDIDSNKSAIYRIPDKQKYDKARKLAKVRDEYFKDILDNIENKNMVLELLNNIVSISSDIKIESFEYNIWISIKDFNKATKKTRTAVFQIY